MNMGENSIIQLSFKLLREAKIFKGERLGSVYVKDLIFRVPERKVDETLKVLKRDRVLNCLLNNGIMSVEGRNL